MKHYVCIWNKPTFLYKTCIESNETLNDENRGFEEKELIAINSLDIQERLQLEDLLIIRID